MEKAEHKYNKHSLSNAKELRKNMTLFEQKLWFYLRAKRFCNIKFKRQVPIGNYIADFVCNDKKLIIELDGSQHLEEIQTLHDTKRDKFFNSLGYKVIRIYNNDINNNIDNVLEYLKKEII